MNVEHIKKLIEQTQAARTELFGEQSTLEGLKANSVDDRSEGKRARGQARKADVKVLNKMKECLDAVIWLNPEIKASAEALAKIEKTSEAIEQRESWEAMWQAQQQAKAGLVEQTNMRTMLLMTVKVAASSLTPMDGRSSWADTPSQVLFDGGPDLIGRPEPDQATVLLDAVNGTRSSAARSGSNDVSDDEFAQLLGVFD